MSASLLGTRTFRAAGGIVTILNEDSQALLDQQGRIEDD